MWVSSVGPSQTSLREAHLTRVRRAFRAQRRRLGSLSPGILLHSEAPSSPPRAGAPAMKDGPSCSHLLVPKAGEAHSPLCGLGQVTPYPMPQFPCVLHLCWYLLWGPAGKISSNTVGSTVPGGAP